MSNNPFDLTDNSAYQRWRDTKLTLAPRTIADLIVEVHDPRSLTKTEHAALRARCQSANMAIYAGPELGEDRTVPRLLGEQLGLCHFDHNRGADEDNITAIRTVNSDDARGEFIPYTNRPIHWHTDGYYNLPECSVHGLILHCARPALWGGANALLDHELAYILLRDDNPDYITALSVPDAMTIPPYIQNGKEIRPAAIGPVFAVTSAGYLYMRYTARGRNVVWREQAISDNTVSNTKVAIAALTRILATTPLILRVTLAPGQGLVCNNVLHDRSGFTDDPLAPRLIYRARYYDRVA